MARQRNRKARHAKRVSNRLALEAKNNAFYSKAKETDFGYAYVQELLAVNRAQDKVIESMNRQITFYSRFLKTPGLNTVWISKMLSRMRSEVKECQQIKAENKAEIARLRQIK